MTNPDSGSAAQPPPPMRLDSWKEIASYLRRDESTVRRWEKTESLPVHRHVHEQRASVFAYPHELDAWLQGRGTDEVAEPRASEQIEDPPLALVPHQRQRARWIAPVAILIGAVLLGWTAWRLTRPAPVETYRVLIAGPVRPDPAFLYDTLEREITDTPGVDVVPRGEVADTLRLMRREPSFPLDEATAREIALRRGDVDAILLGGVEELGNVEHLVLSLRDPDAEGLIAGWSDADVPRTVPTARQFARRVAGEMAASLRLSGRRAARAVPFRGMVGLRIEDATTSSLEAWRLYADAMTLHFAFRWQESAELLERAVAEDPEFATAYVFLGRAYTSLGDREKAASSYRRAFDLADIVSERERYFIEAAYFEHVLQDPARTRSTYSTLLARYPNHYWGVTYASWFHLRYGGAPQVIEYLARYADARPEHLEMAVSAAFALGAWGNSADAADRYLVDARDLLPELVEGPIESFDRLGTGNAAWLALHDVYTLWSRGEVGPALEQLREISDRAHERFRPWLGRAYLALGRLRDAERVFTSLAPDDIHRHEGLMAVALARGDGAALRRHLTDIGFRAVGWMTVLRAREFPPPPRASPRLPTPRGAAEDPPPFLQRRAAARARPAPLGPTVVLATVALRDGRADDATALVESVLPRLGETAEEMYYMALETLVAAWRLKGDPGRAVEALEVTREMQVQAAFGANYRPLLWMRAQSQLAELYRELGRDHDAEALESELAELLAVADDDHALFDRTGASQSGTR